MSIGEHDAFGIATDGIEHAIHGCSLIAQFRPDQRDLWLQMAQTLTVTKEALFRLAGEGTIRT